MQTTSVKPQLRQLVEHAHERQLDQITALSAAEREAVGTPEHWSAKDHLAHTMYWKERLAERLEAAKSGAPMATSEGDVQARNEENFAANATRSWADVLAEDARIHARVLRALAALADEELVTAGRFAALSGEPLLAAVLGNHGHNNEHLAQLYLDRGDVDGAIRVHETVTGEVLEADLPPVARAYALYDLAIFYALIDRSDESLANLTEAVQLHPKAGEWATADPAFASLRAEPEYQALYEGAGAGPD